MMSQLEVLLKKYEDLKSRMQEALDNDDQAMLDQLLDEMEETNTTFQEALHPRASPAL
jgi:hypothetical protein